jgi:BASS family bile acid:Na+ symporter
VSPPQKYFLILANLFPLWVVLGAGLALWQPATALWFQPDWIPFFLGVIMLSMGLTLGWQDFTRVFKIPGTILAGVGLQYVIMPVLGFSLARAFDLPMDYVIGIVLVASCPGGTASNLVCFIARTNVALSVSLTTVSTLLAVVVTPVLTTWLVESLAEDLIGTRIEVNTLGLLLKTFQVVVLPVLIGVFLNHYFHVWVKRVNAYTPFFAVLAIVFIVDFILATKKDEIIATGAPLVSAIVTLHALGFLLGYVLSRLLGFKEKDCQTISIEVGMQNSGLATELARSNFPNFALATVPGAISALTHCILGSLAAGACRLQAHRQIHQAKTARVRGRA